MKFRNDENDSNNESEFNCILDSFLGYFNHKFYKRNQIEVEKRK